MAAQRKAIHQSQSSGMMGGLTGIAGGVLAVVAAMAAFAQSAPICAEGAADAAAFCLPSGLHWTAGMLLWVCGALGAGTAVAGHRIRAWRRSKGLADPEDHPEAPIAD